MNAFDKLIADFAEMTGLGIAPDDRQGCILEAEGMLITIQYRQNADEVVIFVPVTDAEAEVPLTKEMYAKALSLSYDGKGTGGASLGLFDGNLILSTHIPMQGLDAESFGAKLSAFTDTAISTRAEIAAANATESENDIAAPTGSIADFIRV